MFFIHHCVRACVLACSSAHDALWRCTVVVLGMSGVRRLLVPGRCGALARGVSDSRLSPAAMALGASPLSDRLAVHFSARQPWHSPALRRSILSDSGRCGRLAADRPLWIVRSAVFAPRAPPALVLGYRGARALRRLIAWRPVTTALIGFRPLAVLLFGRPGALPLGSYLSALSILLFCSQ
jgi:hypothetical protein